MTIYRTIYILLVLLVSFEHLPAQSILINEFVANNSTGITDEDGDYSDWIELRNVSGAAINLDGWALTDNESNLSKWTFPAISIPANGLFQVWASGKDRRVTGHALHTNFSLSVDGEYLAIVDTSDTVVFEWTPSYPGQFEDISFGLPSGNTTPPGVYFSNTTPGVANGGGDPSIGIPDPGFSIERGVFSSGFNLQILPDAGTTVRYTLDHSEPSSNSGTVYSGPIFIDKTTVVRAIAYSTNGSSNIVTHSYFFLDDVVNLTSTPSGYPTTWNTVTSNIEPVSADYWMDSNLSNWGGAGTIKTAIESLPIMSLSLPVSKIFGNSGFYNNGGKNNNDPFETATSVEILYANGDPGVQINAGVQGRSHAANRNRKRAITIAFKKEYGPGKLEFDVFKDAPLNKANRVSKFDRLMLRSGMVDTYTGFGSHQYTTLIRDGVMRDAQLATSGYGVHHDYYSLFINGMYWGVYGVAERVDPYFASSYFGGQEEDWMVVKKEGGNSIGNDEIDGSSAQYFELVNLLSSTGDNFSNTSNYNLAKTYVNAKEFADYIISVGYHRVGDWPIRNWYFVARSSPREPGFFVAWDSELTWQGGFGSEPGGPWYPPPLYNSGDLNLPAKLWRAFTKNAEFRMLFQDRAHILMRENGPLSPDSSIVRWDAHTNRIYEAIKAEQVRWGNTKAPTENHADWLFNINTTRDLLPSVVEDFTDAFDDVRNGVQVINSTKVPLYSSYGGSVSSGFRLNINNFLNGNGGTIYYTLDGSDPRATGGGNQGTSGGDNTNITISGTMTVKARVLNNGQWSALETATFYAPQMLDKLVINEIHYHPLDQGTIGFPGFVDGDEFEFIEIKNTANVALQLQGVNFSGGIEYVFPAGSIIQPGGFMVLAENAAEFENRYGFAPDGQYSDKLTNSGEQLILTDFSQVLIDSLTYGDSGDWTSDPDGSGPTLSLDPAAGLNNNDPAQWFASAGNNGTPKAENNPNFPPALNITFPADGQRFNPGFAFSIQVTATDANDTVDSVWVQTGELAIGLDETSPYSYAWTPPPGEYNLLAKAWDTFGEKGESEVVQIFIATTNACDAQPNLVINEINYNDDDVNGPLTGDWIELYNPGALELDVSGWTFKDAKNENWIVLPVGAKIPANGYHVIVQDDALFSQVHGISNKTGSFGWGLDGSGDHLRLYTATGCLIDEVYYDDEAPWPTEADGQGMTLELVNASGDNSQASEWQASTNPGGSPGVVNSGLEISVDLLTPASNTGVASGAAIQITARVVSRTLVTAVDVVLDGAVVGQMTVDPNDNNLYKYSLSGLNDGVYNISLQASNSSGQSDDSNPTLVCVGVIGEGPLVESGGQVVFEAEGFSNKIDRGTDAWEEKTTNAGYVGSYMVTFPDDGTKVTTGYATTAAELQYLVNFETTGTYYLWYRGWADSGGNNSVHFGVDGAETQTLNDVGLSSLSYGNWHWTSEINDGTRARVDVTTPGIHNVNLWLREDGTNVDRIILTTDPNYTPTGNGPDESAREVTKVRLRAKVYLSGAFDLASGRMRTDLYTGGYIPTSQPYLGLPVKSVGTDFFSNNPRVVDWVWLELRTGIAANTAVHKEAFLIRDDGWLINPSGSPELGINGVAEGSYYVVIGHRNHLSAMTATTRALEGVDFKTANLSNNAAQAYTSGPEAVETIADNRIGLWSGDVTGDGVIKYTSANNDRVEVLIVTGGPTAFDFATGYHAEDVNMDGIVKYSGSNNDRVKILDSTGGPTSFDIKTSQVPN